MNRAILQPHRYWPDKMLGLVLIIGVILGMVYVFLIPPWQHYDEPGNFEYAWLIANRPGLPKPGDYDQGMRREVAASMIEHSFFTDPSFRPNLLSINEPIWIGISQLTDPPLYYLIASLPLRLLRFTDITMQLYSARLVSFVMFLLTLTAAWGATGEILPASQPLRWMIPLSLTLIPGFVDQMTAVNNDAGAALVFTAFLWTGLRLIRYGINLPRLLSSLALIVLALETKSTAYPVILVEPLILVFALLRGEKEKYAWLLTGLAACLLIAGSFLNDDASLWFRNTLQPGATRQARLDAPLGNNVFELDAIPGQVPPEIVQYVPVDSSRQLAGGEVTLGAWIWASEQVQIVSPALFVPEGTQIFAEKIQVEEKPKFFIFHTTLPDSINKAWVALTPFAEKTKGKISVYYDGLVLLPGNWPSTIIPEFSSSAGQDGTWGGESFVNVIRNSSAEGNWPRFRPQFDLSVKKIYNVQPTVVLNSLLDLQANTYYYHATLKNLFQTFWGKFGWQKVYLLGYHPYTILGLITLLSLIGVFPALHIHRKCLPAQSLLLLSSALTVVWGITIIRGVNSFQGHVFIPPARYTYPVIFPTIGLLQLGWYEIYAVGKTCSLLFEKIGKMGYWSFWIALNLLALYSIFQYYYGR